MATGTIKKSIKVFSLVGNSSLTAVVGQGTTQENVVTIFLAAFNSGDISQGTTIATVPEGYRPSAQKQIPCFVQKADGGCVGNYAYVNADGTIKQNITSTSRAVIAVGSYTL